MRSTALLAAGILVIAATAAAGAERIAGAAVAAPLPPPAAPATKSAPAAKAHKVTGWRSAKWGMTREQVEAAVRKEFGADVRNVKPLDNPADGTTALAAELGKLEPGPGPATVTYIFGKTSKALMHVNIVWLLDGDVAPAARNDLVRVGLKFVDFFKDQTWANRQAIGGMPIGPNSVVMFLAKDEAGGMVEVRADGVPFKTGDGAVSNPSGPARLRVSYGQSATPQDVTRLEPGKY